MPWGLTIVLGSTNNAKKYEEILMPWKASKCYRILSMILVYLSFGSTTAYASVEIHEVQVLNDASDQPVSLVIYGTDFVHC